MATRFNKRKDSSAPNQGFSIEPPTPEAQQIGVRRTPPKGKIRSKSLLQRQIAEAVLLSQEVERPKTRLGRLVAGISSMTILVLNILAGAALVFSAYAQRISPEQWPYGTLVTMTFPLWLLATILLFVLDLAWWRRTAWVAGFAMLACAGQIHDFMPLNMPHLSMSQKTKDNSFSLMTYNVYAMSDFRKIEVGYNRQLEYILEKHPDIVCLQEAHYLSPNSRNHITQSQLDSIHSIYPYVFTQGENFALLSKYPAKPISIDFPKNQFRSGDIAAWRLDIKGRLVNLFSVHLRSFFLTDEDKGAYEDIVKLDNPTRSDLRDAKTAIVPKVTEAAQERAEQVRLLQRYLQRYGGKNAIVCGDFNDPVGCYGLYLLTSQSHMRQAYADAGFGPMITYNANYLYFRIDHVLYRGKLQPWSISRGSINASDHYPVTTTFVLE